MIRETMGGWRIGRDNDRALRIVKCGISIPNRPNTKYLIPLFDYTYLEHDFPKTLVATVCPAVSSALPLAIGRGSACRSLVFGRLVETSGEGSEARFQGSSIALLAFVEEETNGDAR
jgi:hypothetical protein